MEGLGHGEGHEGPPLSHGFKVGVGSVAIAALYERFCSATSATSISRSSATPGRPARRWNGPCGRSHTDPDLEEGAVEQTLAKYISADELAQRLELLRDVWPELREKVREQLMPAEQIKEMLQAAGCPTSPVEIGLSWEEFKATYSRAQTIRKRYTVLDLAVEAGSSTRAWTSCSRRTGFWGRVAASHGPGGRGKLMPSRVARSAPKPRSPADGPASAGPRAKRAGTGGGP